MTTKDELIKENEKLARRIKFLEKAIAEEHRDIEQLVADAFPDEFPLYPEDWGKSYPTRCVGEHTPVTLVMRCVQEIEDQRAALEGFSQIYYRAIWEKGATRPTVSFWRDRLTWKEPFDEFGKQLFVQEL